MMIEPGKGLVPVGLDRLAAADFALLRAARFGVLTNQSAVDSRGIHLLAHLARRGLQPSLTLSPEHGLWSTHQDMEPVASCSDPLFGLPVTSLYGKSEESLAPARELLAGLDLLLVDLQDIGSRYYTFAATMAHTMRALSGSATRVVVADRPNPLGRTMEGWPTQPAFRSYVGELPLPHRHGLTLGEVARFVLRTERLDLDLEVTQAGGQPWTAGPFPSIWVPPSPNMPTVDTALVYPGLCLLEGTNVSEGRGTTTPFLLFGAPWMEPQRLAEAVAGELRDEAPLLLPCCFRPQFQKFAGLVCKGLRIQFVDRAACRPLALGLALIKWLRRLHPQEFDWRRQSYEFVSDRLAIDLLLGDGESRPRLEAGEPVGAILADHAQELSRFAMECRPDLLYPEAS